MPDTFIAQSLVETNTSRDGRTFELIFVDAAGARQAIQLSKRTAADLAPVLASLAASLDRTASTNYTKLPREFAIGRAPHARLVLIRFDDDPPYALDVDERSASRVVSW